MSSPAPLRPEHHAGPSRSGFFPPPFRLIDRNEEAEESSDSYHPRSFRAASDSSRSSTPVLFPNGARFRSASVFSVAQKAEDQHRKQRRESVLRLRSTWDMLHEKYGNIALEDDDEIDLRTGKVVKDRGRLRDLERREFGEFSESEEEDEGSSAVGGPDVLAFEEDEDELGAWDERSGLDMQVANSEDYEEPVRSRWTEEDDEDLREFLRAEAQRRRTSGSDHDDDDDDESNKDDDDERLWNKPSDRQSRQSSVSQYSSDVDHDQEDTDDEPNDLSPRHRGTRILPARLEDLFLSDPEEAESSADELQMLAGDEDDEITRSMPVTSTQTQHDRAESELPGRRMRRRAVEVVIPIRARSVIQRTSSIESYQSSPARPLGRSLAYSALPRPASEPSLANLFASPPPEASASKSRARSFLPMASALQAPTSLTPSRRFPCPSHSPKGKERMIGERPGNLDDNLGDSSLSAYCKNLWHTRSGSLRLCKLCNAAGGERAEKAAWCKGRRGECFLEGHNGSNDVRVEEGESPGPSPAAMSRIPQHRTPSSRDLVTKGTGARKGSRSCRMCREAGGERASKASTCKGRKSWRICPFEWREFKSDSKSEQGGDISDDLESVSSGGERAESLRNRGTCSRDLSEHPLGRMAGISDNEAEQSESGWPSRSSVSRRPRKNRTLLPKSDDLNSVSGSEPPEHPVRRGRSQSVATSTPVRPANLDPGIYLEDFSWSISGTPRSCKHCRIAGGERSSRAFWCKGRSWGKYCLFFEGSQVETSFTHERPGGLTEVVNPIASLQAGPIVSSDTPKSVPSPLRTSRSKRKRVIHSPPDEIPPSAPFLLRIHSAFAAPPSPPPSSLPPSSPPTQFSPDNSYATIRPQVYRSTSSLSSFPPSSPLQSIHNQLSRTPICPTPSPSLSASAMLDGPPLVTARKHTVPFKPIAPLRSATSFRPTPSPSINGARSCSLSSDHIPLSVPRKSALRRPSDAGAPRSSSSVKRTRFSLQPRSPARATSSDPLGCTESSDEYGYGLGNFADSSSPVVLSSVSARYSSSSSPLTNEWSVRAHDVGYKLGPEHTGRVPQGMVKALAPSLSTWKPTLGSSLHREDQDRVTSPNYALPTPPPSYRSSSNRPSQERSSPASSGYGARYKADNTPTAGLMLPPPVPFRRESSARSPTPFSLFEDLTVPTPSVQSPQIRFTSQPAAYLRSRAIQTSRSRSRSVSTAPLSSGERAKRFSTPDKGRSGAPYQREVFTTPSRRKSRIERELARVANATPDDAGLEWGLDEEADDGGRMWREGSVVSLLTV